MSEPAVTDGGVIVPIPMDPREGVEEAIRLDRLGLQDEAIALIDELVIRYPVHQMVLYLSGRIHFYAGRRAHPPRGEEVERHLLRARVSFGVAKQLVPNCIDISLVLAESLHESSMYDEAHDELQRGMAIEYPVDPAESNIVYNAGGPSTWEQRVEFVRESARRFSRVLQQSVLNDHVPRVVRKVLEFDADDRQEVVKALKIANDLAKRYDYSSLAQHIRAYMRLRFAHTLDATINRRQFLLGTLKDMNEAATKFDHSVVLALFRAKLCFVLCTYEIAEVACRQALTIGNPVDPCLEDVPPGSVNGEGYVDRLASVYAELGRLMGRIVTVATNYWYSMTSEKQDSFLSVRLAELHRYYDDTMEHGHWSVKTIADALSFIKKNKSWRIWICPFCVGKKLPDTTALLRHMCSKHPAEKVLSKLQFVVVPKQSDDASEDDYMLEDISVCQDSDDNYIFHFKKRDYIFENLFTIPCFALDGKSFADIRDEKCKAGSMALEKLKQKLMNLPEEKLSTEFDNARPEIEDSWRDFVKASALDYRVVIRLLVKTFIWTNLIRCMKEDNGGRKIITNADIDEIFPSVVDVPGSNGTVEHGPKPSTGLKDHTSVDDQQTVNLSSAAEHGLNPTDGIKDNISEYDQQTTNMEPSCLDVTTEMDEEHKRSVVDVPGSNGTVEHGPKPSTGLKDHISVDDQQTVNLKPLCSDVTLKMDEEHKRSEVHVEDENSDATVNGKPSEEPIKINGYGSKLNATPENVGEDLKYELHVEDENSGTMVNGKPSEEPIEMNEYGSKLNATPENSGAGLEYELHVEDENSGTMVNGKPSEEPIEMNEYGSKLNATPENAGAGLEYEVHVEDENAGAMVNGKPSNQPTNMVEDGNKLNATPENVETDLKCDSSKGTSLPSLSDQSYITENLGAELRYDITEETSLRSSCDQNYIVGNTTSHLLGTSDQPAEEMPSICRYKKNIDVLKKCSADEDLFFLNVIVQSLWNLRRFRHEILRRPPACFHLIHDCPCIADKLYEIFFALEKSEHSRTAPLLTDVKTSLCEIIHDTEMFHKMQEGRIIFSRIQVGGNFASDIMAMIIEGLHRSETWVHFSCHGTSANAVIDPASCTNFICRAHDLFGITLKQLMSCNCGERFSEEYVSIFHELDASSLYTTKTESLAQLPVLMDQQLNREIKCNRCSVIVKHVDCFLSRGARFFTIVLKNWKVGDISKATMSEAFFGIASPFDITLLYRGVILPGESVRSSTKYNLVLAICHVEQRYVSFVRDQERWHVYDTDTVKGFDSWEELLESYKEISIRPEVLFFEVIK